MVASRLAAPLWVDFAVQNINAAGVPAPGNRPLTSHSRCASKRKSDGRTYVTAQIVLR